MRILFFHQGYYPAVAGAEMMTYLLAHALHVRGHTVGLMCASIAGDSPVQAGIEVFEAETTNGTIATSTILDKLGWTPDVVHAVDAAWPDFPAAALGYAQSLQVPFVITPATALDAWQARSRSLDVCRRADAVLALTRTEAAQFESHGIQPDQIRVIGQGPDLEGDPDPARFRRTHGLAGPIVLFLGRKVWFKGYRQLLLATRYVWESRPEASFVFIGPRWDADCQQIFAAHADRRIIELDVVSEAEKYDALAACDILCLPSVIDVFPLVLVEAWACGKPVITSHFPGATEIVRDGHDGLIVAPEPSALATAIAALLSDAQRRHVMGKQGAFRVQTEFNWTTVAGRVEQVYRAVSPR